MCGAAPINSPRGEELGQFLFRARHGRYPKRLVAAAQWLIVVRGSYFVFDGSALHHDN